MIAQKVADYTTQIKLALAAWPGVHVRVEAGEAFVREEGTTPLPSQLPSPLPSPLPLPPSDLQDGRRLQQAGVRLRQDCTRRAAREGVCECAEAAREVIGGW